MQVDIAAAGGIPLLIKRLQLPSKEAQAHAAGAIWSLAQDIDNQACSQAFTLVTRSQFRALQTSYPFALLSMSRLGISWARGRDLTDIHGIEHLNLHQLQLLCALSSFPLEVQQSPAEIDALECRHELHTGEVSKR